VVCWGDPFFDQAAFAGPTDGAFSSISAASELTCGVRSDGRIVCWGFFLPYTDPPESATDWFESVSVGSEGAYPTVCGVRRGDRAVVCWGRSPPFSYSGSSNLAGSFSSVSVGNAFACGVRLDGHVVCVGYYNHGRGPTEPSADVFKSVSAGVDYACGLRADDRIVCWGDNSVGQAPPTPSLDRFKSVSAGAGSTCAVRLDDRILCWGGGGLGL
jgi:hypothetical protein